MHHTGINIPDATYNELTDMINIPTSDGQSFVSISRAGVDQLFQMFVNVDSAELEFLLDKIDDCQ